METGRLPQHEPRLVPDELHPRKANKDTFTKAHPLGPRLGTGTGPREPNESWDQHPQLTWNSPNPDPQPRHPVPHPEKPPTPNEEEPAGSVQRRPRVWLIATRICHTKEGTQPTHPTTPKPKGPSHQRAQSMMPPSPASDSSNSQPTPDLPRTSRAVSHKSIATKAPGHSP
ncbi:hypothetical protein CRENBAI_011690 [Crenichthys baileyi]|uniref:Uncharacterized protein n=1 Tax=Crenichthys baileyi TaxID=28760 RepID=A0AAV9SD72_9TELE